jgi:mono/diheme cytochrome c family protein
MGGKQVIERLALLACAALLAGIGTAQAANPANGQIVARKLCVNCHIVEPGGAPGQRDVPAGVPSFMAIAEKPGQTEDRLTGFMLNPHPPMPQVQLTRRELDDLAAYILSLQGTH